MTSTKSPWLETSGLSRSFGAVQALRSADLSLYQAEIHGLIGPNGAGKSTLVRILCGAVTPDTGSITIDGTVVHVSSPLTAKQFGIVLMPQEITVVPGMTVGENVLLGAEPRRWGTVRTSASLARVTEALGKVGLEMSPSAPMGGLSPAHQRMVMLAHALDRKARLIILDEPTAGLPPHEARLVLDAARRVARDGVTILYVSHRLEEVEELCDRVTAIREGRAVARLDRCDISRAALIRLLMEVRQEAVSEALAANSDAGRWEEALDWSGRLPVAELSRVSGDRLHEVSVKVFGGLVTGVAGLLGSGSDELVEILSGVRTPRNGILIVDGATTRFRSPVDAVRAGIGHLSGDRGRVAIPNTTVRENVSLPVIHKWSRFGIVRGAMERRRVRTSLDSLGVVASSEARMTALSGGNQQRALVARWLAADIELLVLQDPTIGVDIKAREDLWAAIRDFGRKRSAIVSSTEPGELVQLCDRVICLRSGRVTAELAGDELNEGQILQHIA